MMSLLSNHKKKIRIELLWIWPEVDFKFNFKLKKITGNFGVWLGEQFFLNKTIKII